MQMRALYSHNVHNILANTCIKYEILQVSSRRHDNAEANVGCQCKQLPRCTLSTRDVIKMAAPTKKRAIVEKEKDDEFEHDSSGSDEWEDDEEGSGMEDDEMDVGDQVRNFLFSHSSAQHRKPVKIPHETAPSLEGLSNHS